MPTQISQSKPATNKTIRKQNVTVACVHCKKAHLSCDAGRPCRRCVASGKQDTCRDMAHKKRGRPPNKDKIFFMNGLISDSSSDSTKSAAETRSQITSLNEGLISSPKSDSESLSFESHPKKMWARNHYIESEKQSNFDRLLLREENPPRIAQSNGPVSAVSASVPGAVALSSQPFIKHTNTFGQSIFPPPMKANPPITNSAATAQFIYTPVYVVSSDVQPSPPPPFPSASTNPSVMIPHAPLFAQQTSWNFLLHPHSLQIIGQGLPTSQISDTKQASLYDLVHDLDKDALAKYHQITIAESSGSVRIPHSNTITVHLRLFNEFKLFNVTLNNSESGIHSNTPPHNGSSRVISCHISEYQHPAFSR